MTDEQFAELAKTSAYAVLCEEFGVSTYDDAAADLSRNDQQRFFAATDRLLVEQPDA